MNLGHRNIHFTLEEECENKISFLDVTTARIKKKLVTSLYRKTAFSGAYMNNRSSLPANYKKDLFNIMLFRVCSICSDYS